MKKSLSISFSNAGGRGCWQVDCRLMPAPFPLLGVRAAMALMGEGDILRVLATDPEAPLDLPVWCRMTGNRFLDQQERFGVYMFLIRKGVVREPEEA